MKGSEGELETIQLGKQYEGKFDVEEELGSFLSPEKICVLREGRERGR